ncbi:hypothetical protein HPB47_026808 [Ixodes persulcatus]|uniref:Uncharacterized protein n=1 Tax=Ixodes persulcatus TaxID=34615 RepID=A0AC60PY24_IXOPE|nr:hypothetical protein HPB47_026808 [Ixodes persulcatus]
MAVTPSWNMGNCPVAGEGGGTVGETSTSWEAELRTFLILALATCALAGYLGFPARTSFSYRATPWTVSHVPAWGYGHGLGYGYGTYGLGYGWGGLRYCKRMVQREQIAAHIRELLIAAPIDLAEAVTATNGAPDLDSMHALWTSAQLSRFSGFADLQSPEEFIEKLESYCLIHGVKPEDRISRVVPAVLDGSAKLWFRFAGEFTSWGSFVTAFHCQFALVDKKKRLKEELRKRTQHPEENLKQFIYVISSYYDRIGEPVTDAQKVESVLRQMHPQYRDLVEGRTFVTLKELADAADGLMERVWRRL